MLSLSYNIIPLQPPQNTTACASRLEWVVLRWDLPVVVWADDWHVLEDVLPDAWDLAEEEDGEDAGSDTETGGGVTAVLPLAYPSNSNFANLMIISRTRCLRRIQMGGQTEGRNVHLEGAGDGESVEVRLGLVAVGDGQRLPKSIDVARIACPGYGSSNVLWSELAPEGLVARADGPWLDTGDSLVIRQRMIEALTWAAYLSSEGWLHGVRWCWEEQDRRHCCVVEVRVGSRSARAMHGQRLSDSLHVVREPRLPV